MFRQRRQCIFIGGAEILITNSPVFLFTKNHQRILSCNKSKLVLLPFRYISEERERGSNNQSCLMTSRVFCESITSSLVVDDLRRILRLCRENRKNRHVLARGPCCRKRGAIQNVSIFMFDNETDRQVKICFM